jgi:hypothetical protein
MATGTLRQKTVVGDNSSYANFQGWAGDITASAGTGTGIAAALYALGFTKSMDTYNAVWTGGTLPVLGGNLIGTTAGFAALSNGARTALGGANFMGAWVSAVGVYVAGNVVTNGGYVWICISAISSSSTAPPSDATHWSSYFMEIWSMPSSGLTTVYIKLEYGCSATVGDPMFTIQFGTAYVTNSGVLSGNVSLTESCLKTSAVATSTECDWASDGANWFGMYMWRGNATQSGGFFFERGISGQTAGAPVYSTTNQYITWLVNYTGGTWHQCSLFLGSVGTTNSIRNAWATVPVIFTAGTQIVNNISPAYPIFPSVGWIGNPLSVVQAYSVTDSAEGSTISSTVYGTATNYLVTVNSGFVQSLGGTASIYAVGLRTA